VTKTPGILMRMLPNNYTSILVTRSGYGPFPIRTSKIPNCVHKTKGDEIIKVYVRNKLPLESFKAETTTKDKKTLGMKISKGV
jgi:hypothetical protein